MLAAGLMTGLWGETGMRRTTPFFCCLFLALILAGPSAPLVAADLGSAPKADKGDKGATEREVAEFCHGQRQICRKICDMNSRFNDRFDGCPHSCDSREVRCIRTGCYRWTEPDFVIASKYGAHRCAE
jgi:hypothetical protein